MKELNSYAILICDEGNEIEYVKQLRKMNVINHIQSQYGRWGSTKKTTQNIPLDRIVEDPWFKDSQKSYFIQLVDFCAFALLRREQPIKDQMKYRIHTAFNILRPVLNIKANSKDAEGILR